MTEHSSILPTVDSALPRPAPELVERVVDGELILYHPISQRIYALNSTAAYVWQQCVGRQEITEIVTALAERYPESRQDVETDVSVLIEQLLSAGLLTL